MLPKNQINFAMTLLLFSTMFEIALLAKMFVVSDFIYHSIHMLLLIALLGSLLALYFTSNKSLSNRKYALLMATGMVFTTIGDYVNSAISNVNPVSLKLTWALLLFGIGYSIYVFAMWHCYRSRSKPLNGMRFERWYLLALPILVMNVISWFMHIQDYLYPFAVLHYGSFFFNATIYVLMPLGAIGIFRASRYSTMGLLILFGACLIPYSDLMLFSTWLKGNPPVPSFELYAYNWILYFSGQVLITLLAAWAMDVEKTGNH